MPRAARDLRPEAGFTLIEVLVALAVMTAVLAAVMSVASANARGARALEARAILGEVARAVEAGIPPRASLAPGTIEGDISGHRWRMDVRPMPLPAEERLGKEQEAAENDPGDRATAMRPSPWTPMTIAIRIRAPSGATLDMQTIRLARTGAKDSFRSDPGRAP